MGRTDFSEKEKKINGEHHYSDLQITLTHVGCLHQHQYYRLFITYRHGRMVRFNREGKK